MQSIIEGALCVALIFGPILGYIPQYEEISRTHNTEGFSTLVCFILIASNILRAFFWILRRFELTLLFQSLVMIVAQLALLELIVRLNLKRRPHKQDELNYDVTRGFDMNKFWSWDYFGEYLAFLGTFVLSVGILTILNQSLFHASWLTELIGFMALMLESTLAMPQLYRNYCNKSCEGLRTELVLTWFIGDAFKTGFFILRHSPIQFVLCGLIQLMVDFGIAYQMHRYGGMSTAGAGSLGLEGPRHLNFRVSPEHESAKGGSQQGATAAIKNDDDQGVLLDEFPATRFHRGQDEADFIEVFIEQQHHMQQDGNGPILPKAIQIPPPTVIKDSLAIDRFYK